LEQSSLAEIGLVRDDSELIPIVFQYQSTATLTWNPDRDYLIAYVYSSGSGAAAFILYTAGAIPTGNLVIADKSIMFWGANGNPAFVKINQRVTRGQSIYAYSASSGAMCIYCRDLSATE